MYFRIDGGLRSTLLPLREGDYGSIETVGPGRILLKNSCMLAGRLMSCRCNRNNGCRIPGCGITSPIANMRLVQCGSGTLATNAMARRRFDWLNPCSHTKRIVVWPSAFVRIEILSPD